jgi:hypothetical protein
MSWCEANPFAAASPHLMTARGCGNPLQASNVELHMLDDVSARSHGARRDLPSAATLIRKGGRAKGLTARQDVLRCSQPLWPQLP